MLKLCTIKMSTAMQIPSLEKHYLEHLDRLKIWSQDKVQTGNSAVSRARPRDNGEYSPESACRNWNDPIGTFASRDEIEL